MTKHPITLAIALAFAASVGLSGCDRTSNLTEQEHIQRAKDYEDKGNFKGSIIELKNAIQKNPNSPQARLLLGQTYLKVGESEAAEKEFLRAKELGISNDVLVPQIGEALLRSLEFQRVLDEIQASPNMSQKNKAKVLQIRGEALAGLNKLDEGCKLFEESSQLDTNYVPAYIGLAKCALARNQAETARTLVAKAISIDPKNLDTWLLKGSMERLLGDSKATETAFAQAIRINPDSPIARVEHAQSTLALNNIPAAEQDVLSLRKNHPNHYLTHYLQAVLDLRKEKTQSARDHLQETLRQRPDHIPSLVLLGSIQLDLDSPATAESTLGKALVQVPSNRLVRQLLAQSQLKQQSPERALETLQPLLVAEKPEAIDFGLAGEAEMQQGNLDQAKQHFSRAQSLAPQIAAPQLSQARAQLAGGETEAALQNLQAAAKLNIHSSSAEFLIALTHLSDKKYDAALQAIARLEAKSPSDAKVHYLKGIAFLGKREMTKGRQILEQAHNLDPTYTPALMKLIQLDMVEKKSDAAKQRLEQALKKNPNDGRIMLALAQISSDDAQAKAWLEKAIAADPNGIEARQQLALRFTEEGNTQQAMVTAREVVSRNPTSPAALNLLGAVQMSSGDHAGAVSTFKKLVSLLPKSPASHYRLGMALFALGRYDEARSSLTVAAKFSPRDPATLVALAGLELQAQRPTEALRIAKELQRLHPNNPGGYAIEGDVLLAQGKAGEAIRPYEMALDKGNNSKLIVRLAEALYRQGKKQEAEAKLSVWLKTNPLDREVRMYLADRLANAGQIKSAIGHYETMVQQYPRDVIVLNNLAMLYLQAKDTHALVTAEQAYKLQPGAVAVQDTMGWILVHQGQTARGLKLLEQAAAQAPNVPIVRYHLAYAYAQTGDKQRARHELTKLLAQHSAFSGRDEAKALLDKL